MGYITIIFVEMNIIQLISQITKVVLVVVGRYRIW